MEEVKNDIIKKYKYSYLKNTFCNNSLVYVDYIIYIKETENTYESYLQNEKYGVIELMFGVDKKDYTLNDFIKAINENIDNDIDFYEYKHEN